MRLVEPVTAPEKSPQDEWRERAASQAQQLWGGSSVTPLRTSAIETFLRAMPALVADKTTAWREPFAGASAEHVTRLQNPEFEGSATQLAELIERWLDHQHRLARQLGSDVSELNFSVVPLLRSAVVTFGMNFVQRGSNARKRVACWIGRAGEDRFLFGGKLPPSEPAKPAPTPTPAVERPARPLEYSDDASAPIPRDAIFNLPPPARIDPETALTMRRLVVNFCEAHFVRFDNRWAGELYDQIRSHRDVAKAVLPGVLAVMPPCKEKRMLQQLYREL